VVSKIKVLIAGGGIGGITALLALRQRGIAAELFEQAAAFGQVGAGLQVSGNATRILRTLGLGDALAKVAYYPDGRDYRAWDTGDRLYYTPLGERAEARFGAPYYTAHRADLLDVLLGGLEPGSFRLGCRIERFDQDDDGVTLSLADGSTATGDILIGADGIHSTVRGQMFGIELPRYTGNVAWRGLVPAERVARLDVAKVAGVWMGPNRSIVQYYIAAGKTFNWIGISRSEQPARESWLAEGRIEDALAEYAGWNDTIRSIIAATPRVLRQALYDREPLPGSLAGRRGPSDDAVLRARRRTEHRGWLRSGRLSRRFAGRAGRSPRTLCETSPAAHRLDARACPPRRATLPDQRCLRDRRAQYAYAHEPSSRIGNLSTGTGAALRL
jgi:salicylate hydroxylase